MPAAILSPYSDSDVVLRIESLQSQGIVFSHRFLNDPFDRPITDRAAIIPNDAQIAIRDMGQFSLPPDKKTFMMGRLEDLTSENIARWINHSNACECLKFQGYRIYTHVDGVHSDEREVSFVTGERGAYLPPHIHEQSDALLLITGGSAKFVTFAQERVIVNRGEYNLFGRGLRIISERMNQDGEITGFRFALGAVVTDVTAQTVGEGDMVLVPRRMPHGFMVSSAVDQLEFISVQSPPIHNEHTDEFDFLRIEGELEKLIPRIFKFA